MCRDTPTCNCPPPQEGNAAVWPDVEFERGSHELNAAARERIERFFREAAANGLGFQGVRLVGHDDGGEPDDALALARARAVRDFLVSLGVYESWIELGAAQRTEASPDARARPRVEITLRFYL